MLGERRTRYMLEHNEGPLTSDAVRRIWGAMIDALRKLDWAPRSVHRKARAVAAALEQGGYPFAIYNRSRDRAESLVRELNVTARVLSAPDPSGYEVVLNATSASLSGSSVEVDWKLAVPGSLAVDLAYATGPTPFMVEAAAAGLAVHDGRRLLVAQGAWSIKWWLGVEPPRSAMLSAIS